MLCIVCSISLIPTVCCMSVYSYSPERADRCHEVFRSLAFRHIAVGAGRQSTLGWSSTTSTRLLRPKPLLSITVFPFHDSNGCKIVAASFLFRESRRARMPHTGLRRRSQPGTIRIGGEAAACLVGPVSANVSPSARQPSTGSRSGETASGDSAWRRIRGLVHAGEQSEADEWDTLRIASKVEFGRVPDGTQLELESGLHLLLILPLFIRPALVDGFAEFAGMFAIEGLQNGFPEGAVP